MHTKMHLSSLDSGEAVKFVFVCIEFNLIFSRRRCKAIIGERGSGVEIERKDTIFSLKNQYLFLLILHKKFRPFVKNGLLLRQMHDCTVKIS